jgi:ABC-type transport system involved in cytochrome c biogenesis permease subunit
MIAHNLAVSGDTLEMMQAVLDDNFWLASHVTTVTMGYSATYIAAAVALVYIVVSALPQQFLLKRPIMLGSGKPMEIGRVIGQILYGIVCFATLLSFVGTVLGGIWADFSWGRFWGWDPKENGAVLIVLWNALILHARWAGLVKDRGMAVLAVVGAMITTWSWFGTNQLGVGLHAYGFSNKLAFGCAVTWVLLLIPIVTGLLPWGKLWTEAVPVKRA